ncbi:nucleotidyltransferase [Candidatus Micrarchaeota archaeon]|nr:nucleotidyltransferase [Candidatus Micrarchaeota archaeon]MBU2476393.1 nucleotidyltransferase [Candidatus Micrarchaeota archaeon]
MIFEEREKFVFSLLEEIKADFVVIGGYAVNAFTLPRFSVDCDIVVKNNKDLFAVKKFFESKGFNEKAFGETAYNGKFLCLSAEKPVKVTFDVLAENIEDRITGTIFTAKQIFKHSEKRIIYGKGSPIKIKTRVVNPEMLFVMKSICSRKTDIRDVFMLASIKLDKKKIKEISDETPIPKESIKKILEKIESTGFKDALQGVYGMLPEEQFQKTKNKLKEILTSKKA